MKVSFSETKCKFYSAFNALYSKVGCILDINIVIHFMEFIAVPILCYALESLDLAKSEINSLDFTFKRALFKIFKVSNSDDLLTCMNMFNISSMCDKYAKKKYKFQTKMRSIDNVVLSTLNH